MTFTIFEHSPPTLLENGHETGTATHDVSHLAAAGAYRYIVRSASIQNPCSPSEAYITIEVPEANIYTYGFTDLDINSGVQQWCDAINSIFADLVTEKQAGFECEMEFENLGPHPIYTLSTLQSTADFKITFHKSAHRVFGMTEYNYVNANGGPQPQTGIESFIDVRTVSIQTSAPVISNTYININNQIIQDSGTLVQLSRHRSYIHESNNIPIEFRTATSHTQFRYELIDQFGRIVPATFSINYTVHCN